MDGYDKFEFSGKKNGKFEFFVLRLFGEKSLAGSEPFLAYYFRDHIVPVMENETQEEKTKRLNGYMESNGKKFDGLTIGELAALRRGLHTLDPMVIVDISKEVMKLI